MFSEPIKERIFREQVPEIIKHANAMSLQIGGNMCVFTHDGNVIKVDTPLDMDHQKILTLLISETIQSHTYHSEGDGLYLFVKTPDK